MTYVITQGCIDQMDRSCIKECPVDCIYEADRQLFINPNECIDCGACEPVCPHNAIYYELDLPDELAPETDRQAEIFADLGRLGGARRYGRLPSGT